MKACLNIICKKEFSYHIKEQIEFLVHLLNAELMCIDENVYWKEGKCHQVFAEISLPMYSFEKTKEAIEELWTNGQTISYFEDQEFIEFAVYSTISEMLQQDKVFVTFNLTKPSCS